MIKIKKEQVKKIFMVIFIILLTGYVLWDISLRAINYFRTQGYQLAIIEITRQAENTECSPFNVFIGDKRINLINVSCLQTQGESQEEVIEPVLEGDDF